MTRFASPPWKALGEATNSGDIIEIGQMFRNIHEPGRWVWRVMWDAVHMVRAGEAIPKGARVEFDEDGNVWLAKDTGA